MDNFQFNNLNLDFDFDFQRDFTFGENRVIDDILSTSNTSSGLFETSEESSSFFQYLCNDSSTASDLESLDEISRSQLVPFEYDVNQAGFGLTNLSTESNGIASTTTDTTITTTADQNENFDWTTFLDDSPVHQNPVADQSSECEEITIVQSNDRENVIQDNGFIYQELKTLDIPQMYADLGQTFGFDDLKKIDDRMNYATLPDHPQPNRNDRNSVNMMNNILPIAKKRVFLVPLQLGGTATDALHNVAKRLKNNPSILNTMLNRCINTTQTVKIRLLERPKQIKQKSERYLTVNEQLQLINTKEITLPMSTQKTERRKRKQTMLRVIPKVPAKDALEMILTDVNENISSETTKKKSPKTKKVTPKEAHGENDETSKIPKKSRRSSKKNKFPLVD